MIKYLKLLAIVILLIACKREYVVAIDTLYYNGNSLPNPYHIPKMVLEENDISLKAKRKSTYKVGHYSQGDTIYSKILLQNRFQKFIVDSLFIVEENRVRKLNEFQNVSVNKIFIQAEMISEREELVNELKDKINLLREQFEELIEKIKEKQSYDPDHVATLILPEDLSPLEERIKNAYEILNNDQNYFLEELQELRLEIHNAMDRLETLSEVVESPTITYSNELFFKSGEYEIKSIPSSLRFQIDSLLSLNDKKLLLVAGGYADEKYVGSKLETELFNIYQLSEDSIDSIKSLESLDFQEYLNYLLSDQRVFQLKTKLDSIIPSDVVFEAKYNAHGWVLPPGIEYCDTCSFRRVVRISMSALEE